MCTGCMSAPHTRSTHARTCPVPIAHRSVHARTHARMHTQARTQARTHARMHTQARPSALTHSRTHQQEQTEARSAPVADSEGKEAPGLAGGGMRHRGAELVREGYTQHRNGERHQPQAQVPRRPAGAVAVEGVARKLVVREARNQRRLRGRRGARWAMAATMQEAANFRQGVCVCDKPVLLSRIQLCLNGVDVQRCFTQTGIHPRAHSNMRSIPHKHTCAVVLQRAGMHGKANPRNTWDIHCCSCGLIPWTR